MNVLTFYFDYISHNAYLAWTQIGRLCEKYELVLEPVPVLFAGMLKANGQLGPAEVPDKSMWMLRDVLRKAKQLDIPIKPPVSHPFNPLAALRVTCTDMKTDQRIALVTALFEATWAEGRDVTDPAVIADVVLSVGLDAERVAREAISDKTKNRLRQQTQTAIDASTFGVPTMLVNDRLFWGFDDLEPMDAFLGGEDPVSDRDIEPWLQVKPTVQRVKK
jgi:2-hydroxychromene-2-carboxylate isomerase